MSLSRPPQPRPAYQQSQQLPPLHPVLSRPRLLPSQQAHLFPPPRPPPVQLELDLFPASSQDLSRLPWVEMPD
jgi:hypothetical protein